MTAFKIMMMTTFVAMVAIEEVKGQSYHFSNGWNPGGKRSMQAPVCHFRQEVQTLISRLIEDEVRRMVSDSKCLGASGDQTLRNLFRKKNAYDVPLDNQK